MSKIYYTKSRIPKIKVFARSASFILLLIGLSGILYVLLPFLSWQIFFAPAFASQTMIAPIPKTTIVDSSTIKSLLATSIQQLSGVDYTNAQNWFPDVKTEGREDVKVKTYHLSIPSLGIKDAIVSTVDYDLASHLVNYIGTAVPPGKGNAVVFGHSTLPQLFNPKDYTAIFATAYKLKMGDEIYASLDGISYKYVINAITITDPSDMSVFSQDYNDSYLTLVTCTPPGTTWKRLIIRSRLEKI